MTVDVLFLAWNRLEFTKASLAMLHANTDWALVDRLVVYDDGSEDGTRELLDELLPLFPCETVLRAAAFGSPVGIMLDYLAREPAPLFAKIDSDVACPPGWLEAMLGVLDRHPNVELLGMEAGMSGVAGRDGVHFDGVYGFEPATNIGGVGLMRTSMFERLPRMRADGRHGFSELQHTYRPVRGWITPDLPVALLDRLPFEPWRSLSAEYVERGWQRDWPAYSRQWMEWAWQWFAPEEVAA